MKKSIPLLFLTLFLLSACQIKKPYIEAPMPSSPPNPALMQPQGEPNS